MAESGKRNLYSRIIEWVFFEMRPRKNASEFGFERDDLLRAVNVQGLDRPKNLGDVVYSLRYRYDLPASIRETQPEGMEWVIEGAGKGRY